MFVPGGVDIIANTRLRLPGGRYAVGGINIDAPMIDTAVNAQINPRRSTHVLSSQAIALRMA